MPRDLLGPTLEDVQMWLRSASGWVSAGFVLNVEPVNARLGRVLVVEDDPGIATQMVRGLTRAGYETGSVTTGQAALDWPVPDVVLLDLGLPDIDGVEVCRRLRQSCDAAIIIVSARGEESDRVLALDEGADDYLIKPFGLRSCWPGSGRCSAAAASRLATARCCSTARSPWTCGRTRS